VPEDRTTEGRNGRDVDVEERDTQDLGTDDLNTGELETLARYLDGYRDVIVWKLEGLDEEQVRRRLVPSLTSLLGIVKHLAFVERYWFQRVIAGRDVSIPWLDDDGWEDAQWHLSDEETIAEVVGLYETEIAESRRIHSALDDPDLLVNVDGDPVSVRRILIHMVEEVARHAGHADILRELIDGTTGVFPEN
jgi:uncharacterized damage-inducible protein DinB